MNLREFVEWMDEEDAFAVPAPNYVSKKLYNIILHDGVYVFNQSHWHEVMALWADLEANRT